MATENNVFLNNSGTNEQIFKIPTAYDHYRQHAYVKHFGSQNILPVRSGKFKMAAENNVFFNNSGTNEQIFKTPTANDYYRQHAHEGLNRKNEKKCAKTLCSKMFPFRIERDTPS